MAALERIIPLRGHSTWALVIEPTEPVPGALPVVVLHGGPGIAHDSVQNLDALSRDGRTVVHCDQLGCGRSTHLPDAPEESWSPQRSVHGFRTVVETLGLERYHVVGQSWGGMLAVEIALTHPAGLAGIGILDSPASMDLRVRGADTLRRRRPEEVRGASSSTSAPARPRPRPPRRCSPDPSRTCACTWSRTRATARTSSTPTPCSTWSGRSCAGTTAGAAHLAAARHHPFRPGGDAWRS